MDALAQLFRSHGVADDVLSRVMEWLVEQDITDMQSLEDLQLDDLAEVRQWPPEIQTILAKALQKVCLYASRSWPVGLETLPCRTATGRRELLRSRASWTERSRQRGECLKTGFHAFLCALLATGVLRRGSKLP